MIAVQIPLHEGDRQSEQYAGREHRCDGGTGCGGWTESQERERQADVSRIRIRRAQSVECPVAECPPAAREDQRQDEHSERADTERGDESRLMELRRRYVRDVVEDQRRQREARHEAVELDVSVGPEDVEFAGTVGQRD